MGATILTPDGLSSPAANDVVWTREIVPFLPYLGPAWFRRFLLQLMPIPSIQRLKTITDIMAQRTEEIYFAKKKAIESGDKELLNALGEGKDIMSVLCEYTRYFKPTVPYDVFNSEGEPESVQGRQTPGSGGSCANGVRVSTYDYVARLD